MRSRFDAAHWRRLILASADARVPCHPPMAQVAAEHYFGRSFTVQPFLAERHFQPVLLVLGPDQAVTGGQARGPWALVPEFDRACGRLMPALWRQRGTAHGWFRVAAFRDATAAAWAARALHLAPAWIAHGPAGESADIAIVERVLIAEGLVPGQVPGSALRLYGWRVRP